MRKSLYVVWTMTMALVLTGAASSSQAASLSVKSLSISSPLTVKPTLSTRPAVVSTKLIPTRIVPLPTPTPPPVQILIATSSSSAAVGNIGKNSQDECEDECDAGFTASNQDDSIYMKYDLFVVVEGGIRLPDELR